MNIIEKYKKQYEAVIDGPASDLDVDEILNRYGVSNSLYRDWLIQTGGGPIGPDWYDTLAELEESQKNIKNEFWTITGFVIGWDGTGNPIVLSEDGKVITEDHNTGETYNMAFSFEALLAKNVDY